MVDLSETLYVRTVETPVGRLVIGEEEGMICLSAWEANGHAEKLLNKFRKRGMVVKEETTPELEEAIGQLREFFSGKRTNFYLEKIINGTDLQLSVWTELMSIPYNSTVSYLDLAKHVGRPDAVRAVANAVGANPLSVIIPCHRVVGSDGRLTGYAGGLEIKKGLIDLESETRLYP